jgi:hypothetical protein
VDPLPALAAKTMAAKPHAPFNNVTKDGRMVMFLSRCLRTLLRSLFRAAFVFIFFIICT